MERKKSVKKTITWVLMFLFAFMLSIIGMMGITNIGYASTSGSLSVSGLTATESAASGTASWTLNGTSITGSCTGKAATSGCNSTPASSATSTLTLKNTKGQTATFSFSYSVTLNSGTVTIGGNSITSSGTYGPVQFANNATLVIKMTSAEGASTTTVNITALSLIVEAPITGTFLPATSGGTYTVNGNPVTSETAVSQMSTDPFTLVATPASGYEFYGWHVHTSSSGIDDTSVESTTATYNLYRDTNFYVKPEFMKSGTAIFSVNGTLYNDLNKANTAASSNGKLIVLNANGTLYAGTYTISSGNTLLMPFDAANTYYEAQPTTESATGPSAFRTLSISYGVIINISGNLNVSSKVSQADGRPSGKYGAIKFLDLPSGQTESVINMKSGSKLYCWGYIWGNSGKIIAENGSTLYESFQLAGWRGGSATSGMLNNSQKVFPVNQYFVQNIEVYTKIEYGAKEILFTATTMSIVGTSKISVDFIGTSAGMFRMSSGSYITKRYVPSKDSLFVEVFGTVTLSSITIKANVTINSANYVLPLSSCMDITILNSGNSNSPSQVITNQDLAILPGSKMTIEQNAVFSIQNNNSVYVYDYEQWRGKGYGHTNSSYPMINTNDAARVYYTPSSRTPKTSLSDAEIDINGSVNVASGAGLYTTTNGAHIHSSEMTGNIIFSNGPGNKTSTYQAVQSGTDITYDTIAITNAKLHNGEQYYNTDDEYYLTDNVDPGYNVTYDSVNDKWGETAAQVETIHVLFRDKENNSNQYNTSYEYPGNPFTFPTQTQAGFTNPNNYKIRKWYTEDQNGKADLIYNPNQQYDGRLDDNTTFYSYYGGWMTDKNSVVSYTYRTNSDTPTYPNGLAIVENLDGEGEDMYYFTGNGILCYDEKVVYYNIDGSYYYVNNGVLTKDAGVVVVDTDGDVVPDSYYYIDADGKALVSQVVFLNTKLNGLISPGLYEIDSTGKIIFAGTPNSIDANDYVRDSNNHKVLGYGLFCLSSENPKHFYYCQQDGKIVKSQTFYVSKTNGCWVKFGSQDAITIEEGLYYFDENGYMWYGNNILGATAPVEFSVIVTGNINGTTVTIGGGN